MRPGHGVPEHRGGHGDEDGGAEADRERHGRSGAVDIIRRAADTLSPQTRRLDRRLTGILWAGQRRMAAPRRVDGVG